MLFKVQTAYTSLVLQTMHCKSKEEDITWICYPPSNRRSIECTCSIYLTTDENYFCNHSLKKKKKRVLISWYFYDLSMLPGGLRVGWHGVSLCCGGWLVCAGGIAARAWASCLTAFQMGTDMSCCPAVSAPPLHLPARVLPSLTILRREPNKEKCTVDILMRWCKM